MNKWFLFLCVAAVASGCGEVLETRLSTVTYQGDSYTVRTETVQVGDRVYDVSRVTVGAVTKQCLVDSPGSCEAAVAEAKEPVDRNR